ncbi:MAG: FAD:protein FMN transferase [Ruminococcus sp.]|nr:FAD:protein FMN transferase [Ruminococcus sp.]
MKILKQTIPFCLSLVLLLCVGCNTNTTSDGIITSNNETSTTEDISVSQDIFAMDTYMTITAYGDNADQAVDEAIALIEELDAQLSTGSDSSEITLINQNGNRTLSAAPAEILSRALEISEMTDGAFNPAMYPIMEAWGFPTQNYRVPTDDELESLLPLTNLDNMTFNETSGEVTLSTGMALDLGGIVKGYTSSQIMDIFTENGITSGIVSLGGNVQTLGTKTDGNLWRVALQNPDESADYLGVLEIDNKTVITSGSYERYFEEDGITYHHIIDPKIGYPADSGLQSVTIVSDDGTLADGLSTALFVMGLDEGITFWRSHSDEFDVIFYTTDNKLYVSQGLKNIFSSDSYEWEIIEEASET